MSQQNDKYNKKGVINKVEDDSEGESGQSTGGQSGQIEFRDFLAGGERLRDDLSPDELKHALAVLSDASEQRIKDQQKKRDLYKDLRNGKVPLRDFRAAMGMNVDYRAHPTLADKAQFSGADKEVNALPTENIAETNNEKRNQLQMQYNLRHHPEYANTNKLTPKLTPFGK